MTTVAEKDDVSEGIDVDVVDMESHLEEAFFFGGVVSHSAAFGVFCFAIRGSSLMSLGTIVWCQSQLHAREVSTILGPRKKPLNRACKQ